MSTVKLAIIALDLSRTGGTRVLVEIANGLVNRGYQVTFLVPSGTECGQFETQAHVIAVGPRWISRLGQASNFVSSLFLCRGWSDADVALATYYPTALSVWFGTRFRRHCRGCYFIQGYEPLFAQGRLAAVKRLIARCTYKLSLHRLVNSRWLGEVVVQENGGSYDLVTPGVDTDVFRPYGKRDPGAQPIIGAIARRGWVKGADTLAIAINKLWAMRQDFSVALVMPEPVSLSIEAPVEILQPRNDSEMCEFYNSVSVFAFPSRIEGFGLPPLEAMACGTPVVTTDCGGVREFATHRENCLVVPTDDPSSLANGLNQLLSDPLLYQRLVEAGRETAKRFTWEHTVIAAERAIFGPKEA